MKYLIVLVDGAGDRPLDELGGRTPLQVANKPNIDMLAKNGNVGLTSTLTESMPLGSDVANLAVLGYQPKRYYTGRSPVEALGLNLPMSELDMVFRMNLVNIDYKGTLEESIMIDHSSDKISDEEGKELVEALNEYFNEKYPIYFYPGASYRNIAIWKDFLKSYKNDGMYIPPHDILTKCIGSYLPQGEVAEKIIEMCEMSIEFLSAHPINVKRREKGLKTANCIWFWGEGTKPALDNFHEKYSLNGTMISAVPLLKGIANGTGMCNIDVEGATGDINTNFEGKADAAIKALNSECDFVFVHLEAPDECGHDGNAKEKVQSIEYIDERVLGRILEGTKNIADLKILLMPDHATPIAERTHTIDPVPFIIYTKGQKGTYPVESYTEENAKSTGYVIENGYDLMNVFVEN